MTTPKQTKNQHLLWRSGFGPCPADFARLKEIRTEKLYRRIEQAAMIKPKPFDAVNIYIKAALLLPASTMEAKLDKEEKKKFSAEQRRIINQNSKHDLENLTLQWTDRMVNGPSVLREKLTLFWHGHFACRVTNSLYQQQLLNDIRGNAFESFGDLLRKVSKSAAMLSFLNNQQNKKKKPNENFARELMELFTLGIGNYTEQDVKEAAKAFTGWNFSKDGQFSFQPRHHDETPKTFLGVTGNLTGDDILNIILKQKQTARFVTGKVYRYFVNQQLNEQHVDWLAERFYAGNYNIAKLMRDIFTSDWFYEEQNIGNRIKSPVEYLAGIRTLLPMSVRNEKVQLLLHRILGQWLFHPPNVAGWPEGYAWIDSSTLMLRLRIPQLIKEDEALGIKPKTNDDVDMGKKETLALSTTAGKEKPKKAGNSYQMIARIDWAAFEKAVGKNTPEQLFLLLKTLLLQTPLQSADEQVIAAVKSKALADAPLKTLTIALMSTPEYQLC